MKEWEIHRASTARVQICDTFFLYIFESGNKLNQSERQLPRRESQPTEICARNVDMSFTSSATWRSDSASIIRVEEFIEN